MNWVRKAKVYLTRRIRRQVTLTRREEGLSQIRVLGINLKISLRITIRELILKAKNHIILQHKKEGICLTTLLKIMNKRTCQMLEMSRTLLCQVLYEPEGEIQQCTHYLGRGNNWRCGKWNAQNKCSLGEPTSIPLEFHGGSARYDTKPVCFHPYWSKW